MFILYYTQSLLSRAVAIINSLFATTVNNNNNNNIQTTTTRLDVLPDDILFEQINYKYLSSKDSINLQQSNPNLYSRFVKYESKKIFETNDLSKIWENVIEVSPELKSNPLFKEGVLIKDRSLALELIFQGTYVPKKIETFIQRMLPTGDYFNQKDVEKMIQKYPEASKHPLAKQIIMEDKFSTIIKERFVDEQTSKQKIEVIKKLQKEGLDISETYKHSSDKKVEDYINQARESKSKVKVTVKSKGMSL
jgi:alpha-acetolactate decarboxylase